MKPNEKEYIYTDEVDYENTSDESIWGTEDKATTKLLNGIKITGKWLNLCAGDGRFNKILLEKADQVVATDIDNEALKKLVRITPKKLVKKLIIKNSNIVEKFAFENEIFDGIFCVGTLHLFPKPIFRKIEREMERVLKPEGRIIIDFATDIQRKFDDGSLWIIENEPNYNLKEGKEFLKQAFTNCNTKLNSHHVKPEKVKLDDKEYVFTSNFILVNAIKKK